MICNAETYAASGHHHHIATLLAGRSFEGVYLIAEPPETTCIDGEMGLIFIASDLTGSIKCLVDPVRAGWVILPSSRGHGFKHTSWPRRPLG